MSISRPSTSPGGQRIDRDRGESLQKLPRSLLHEVGDLGVVRLDRVVEDRFQLLEREQKLTRLVGAAGEVNATLGRRRDADRRLVLVDAALPKSRRARLLGLGGERGRIGLRVIRPGGCGERQDSEREDKDERVATPRRRAL